MNEIVLELDNFQLDWLIMQILPKIWENRENNSISKVEEFFFDLIEAKTDIFKCKFCYWSDGFTGDCMVGLEPEFEGLNTCCVDKRYFKAGTGFCINEDDFSHGDVPYHAERLKKFKKWKSEALVFKNKILDCAVST